MRSALILVFGLAAAACADQASMHSPAYQEGFSDGCATASAQASGTTQPPQRNAELAAKDADYRAGWNAGHAVCERTGAPAHY
jgi:hypothetical protein